MANILLCFSSTADRAPNAIDAFYEGFIDALVKAGNQLLVLRTNNSIKSTSAHQSLVFFLDHSKLKARIQDFQPEVIFTFNNALYDTLLEECDVPVVLFSSETWPYVYSKPLLERYASRYWFVHFSEVVRDQFIDATGTAGYRHLLVPCATACTALPLLQDRPITFIGSSFPLPQVMEETYKKLRHNEALCGMFFKAMSEIENAPNALDFSALDALNTQLATPLQLTDCFAFLSRKQRLSVLQSVSPLGLHIFGYRRWLDLIGSYPDIAQCYHADVVYSVAHTTECYNRSQLCLNIPHIQSTAQGTSFRVVDIMATNAVLVTPKNTTQYFNVPSIIPTYDTAHDAYDVSQALLADPSRRADISQACREWVEQKGRFHHRITEIEAWLGMTLHTEQSGTWELIDPITLYRPGIHMLEISGQKLCRSLPTPLMHAIAKLIHAMGIPLPHPIKLTYLDR